MRFNREINVKAWAIYKIIRKSNPTMSHRKAWSLALKDTFKFFKNLLKGVVTFFKLPKKTGGKVEITTRRIAPLTLAGFDFMSGQGSIFKALDLDKVDRGEKHCIISFHNFQMI